MASVVKIKRSTTAGAAPSSLASGEIAINEADGKLFWRDGAGNVRSMLLAASAGGGSGQAVLDFGTTGAFDASVAVTGQAAILATSTVVVSLAAVATADHSADEHLVEDIEVRASVPTAGTGFTIRGRAGDFPLRGRWTVSWMWV